MANERTKIVATKTVSKQITIRSIKLGMQKMDLIALLAKIPMTELKELVKKYLS